MSTLQLVNYALHPEQGQLEVRWKSGERTFHSFSELRRKCPCAGCVSEREKIEAKSAKGPVLRVISSPGPTVQTAQILEVKPVGRYALAFRFNDGHQTGIFTYDFIYGTRLQQT